MREDHSENRNRRLQDRGETGGNVKFRPEKERVIHAEHQNAGPGEQFKITAAFWNQRHAADGDRKQNDNRNHEPDRDERDRRQIAQPKLDRQPGRAPDEAERNERSDGRESGTPRRHCLITRKRLNRIGERLESHEPHLGPVVEWR